MRRLVYPPLTDGSYVFFSFPHRHESWHVDGEDVVRELPLELVTFKTLIKIQQGKKIKFLHGLVWLLQTIMITFQQLGLGQCKKSAKVV